MQVLISSFKVCMTSCKSLLIRKQHVPNKLRLNNCSNRSAVNILSDTCVNIIMNCIGILIITLILKSYTWNIELAISLLTFNFILIKNIHEYIFYTHRQCVSYLLTYSLQQGVCTCKIYHITFLTCPHWIRKQANSTKYHLPVTFNTSFLSTLTHFSTITFFPQICKDLNLWHISVWYWHVKITHEIFPCA